MKTKILLLLTSTFFSQMAHAAELSFKQVTVKRTKVVYTLSSSHTAFDSLPTEALIKRSKDCKQEAKLEIQKIFKEHNLHGKIIEHSAPCTLDYIASGVLQFSPATGYVIIEENI